MNSPSPAQPESETKRILSESLLRELNGVADNLFTFGANRVFNENLLRKNIEMNPFQVDFVAFRNDPKIKEKYLARVRAHRAADQIIKGKYWEDGRGCAVGCTVHSDSHTAYEKELGIPRILARLEDGIFEGLPNGKALAWPEAFLEAIPVGADLSLVWPKFAVWLLGDPNEGVIRFAKTERTKKAIQATVDAYQLVIEGTAESVDWGKLRAAAYADAAADAAADDAAYAATAKSKARVRQSEKLLELLSVTEGK